jgi:hypothetical protein
MLGLPFFSCVERANRISIDYPKKSMSYTYVAWAYGLKLRTQNLHLVYFPQPNRCRISLGARTHGHGLTGHAQPN